MPCGHLYVFSGEMSVINPIFSVSIGLLFLLLLLSCMSCSYVFGIKPLSVTSFTNTFFPAYRLSFHFIYGFLCYTKAYKFALLDLRKYWYNLFSLCSLLEVLWCYVLYVSLSVILSLFLCMVWGRILTSFIYRQLSIFPAPVAEKTLFPIVYSCLFCRRLFECRCVDFLTFYLYWGTAN